MSIDKQLYQHLKEDERVKKEIKKIKRIYKDIPPDKKSLTDRLIENAGFMAILLLDLQDDIRVNGYKEQYQNGANQHGFKRSVAADLYQVVIKNYSSTIKQLTDLLPKKVEEEDDDGFEAFLRSR